MSKTNDFEEFFILDEKTSAKIDQARAELEEKAQHKTNQKYMDQINKSRVFFSINKDDENYEICQKISSENPNALFVFYCIISKMDKYNAAYTSQREIAEISGLSERTVFSAFQTLKNYGLIWRNTETGDDFFKYGTYFVNQNFISKQSIKTLKEVPDALSDEMRRNCGFRNWVQLDAHVASFRKMIEIGKEYIHAFNFWFLNLFEMNSKNNFVAKLYKFSRMLNVTIRTIKNYIKYLKEVLLVKANDETESVFQVNSLFAWKRAWKRYKDMFEADIAGVKASHEKASNEWHKDKSVAIKIKLDYDKEKSEKIYDNKVKDSLHAQFEEQDRILKEDYEQQIMEGLEGKDPLKVFIALSSLEALYI